MRDMGQMDQWVLRAQLRMSLARRKPGEGDTLDYVNHTQVLVVIKVDNDFFFGFCRIRAFETPCFTASDTD